MIFLCPLLALDCYLRWLFSRFTVLGGNHWANKTDLTYNIYRYTPDLEKSVVDREIAKAFRLWEDVTPFTFTFIDMGKVDIEIR